MTARFDRVLSADAVVVGTGIAGLTAALELAPRRVVVLSKGQVADGSTPYAQGGIAAAMGADDSPAAHARDTLDVGGGLNDTTAVEILTAMEAHPKLMERPLVVKGKRAILGRPPVNVLSLLQEG